MSEIKLGNKVRDKVTGFTGIATAKIEYINGCIQYCVKPKVAKDNTMSEGEYIDIDELEVIRGGIKIKSTPSGGPQRDCPKG